MTERQVSLALAAGVYLAALSSARGATLETWHFDPHSAPVLGKVDERFQSYNVEMAEVIGAKFWKPYAHMAATPNVPRAPRVGADNDMYEARAPVDLYARRLRLLAAALGPAYVRVSGTWANSVYFQNDDAPAMATPPAGYLGVLTRAQWRGVIDFAKAVDARLVTSFTISSGVRDADGGWTPVEAQPLLDFTRAIGGHIFAAELFNEPNLPTIGGAPKGYDAAAFVHDEAAFRRFATASAPTLRIVGPGDLNANLPLPGPTAVDLLATAPRPRFDVFSYHFYGAASQRCAPANTPMGASRDDALSDAWLARSDEAIASHKLLRDRYAASAPIWLTETAQALCGGSPWAAEFVDSFRYLDQMGRLARQGVSVIFHNTLAASEYGLVDQTTLAPRPSYWAALLWRRLMGPIVLDAGPIQPGVHLYAHCTVRHPGSVSLLAINLEDGTAQIDVSSNPANLFTLTAPSLDREQVDLNGKPLAVDADGRLPKLRPQRLGESLAVLPPHSITFITLPRAENPHCT